jgi:hypothetical protein
MAVFSGRDKFCFPKRDVVLVDLHNTSTERLAEFITERVLGRLREQTPPPWLTTIEVEVEESAGQCGVYTRTLESS